MSAGLSGEASSSVEKCTCKHSKANHHADHEIRAENRVEEALNLRRTIRVQLLDPRASGLERLMQQFGLTEDSDIKVTHGEAVDLSAFEDKIPIPSSRLFTQFRYLRSPFSNGQRPTTMYTCDHQLCGKFFKKPQGLFDHLRTHTGEKPFACPVLGCQHTFNQVANQKKHL